MAYQPSRRQVLAAAAGLVALGLAGCGGDDSNESSDLEGKRVGAMEKYGVGDQFKATEALTFSVLYNNHPN
jgi:putative aldouronate transport system substrate-binding protein